MPDGAEFYEELGRILDRERVVSESRKPASIFKGFEWRGEYTDMDVTDYWCPTKEKWSMCPGPCPDGTPHGPERTQTVQARVLVAVSESRNTADGTSDYHLKDNVFVSESRNESLEDTIAAALAELAVFDDIYGAAESVAVAVREWEARRPQTPWDTIASWDAPREPSDDFSAVITDTEGNRLRVQSTKLTDVRATREPSDEEVEAADEAVRQTFATEPDVTPVTEARREALRAALRAAYRVRAQSE